MTEKEYKHKLERYHSTPILKTLNIETKSSEKPDMEYVDENGRNIGIEITECWCRDIILPEMDDYTSSSCYAYKTLIKKRGEKGLWITVFFFDSVFKELPNMSKKKFLKAACEEIDRHIKYDSVLDDPNITCDEIKEFLAQKVFDYRFVSSISLSEMDNDLVDVMWTQGTFVNTISEDAVLKYIEKKESIFRRI